MAEPVVHASAGECDNSHHAQLLEIRRIAGTGTPDSQQWWRASLVLLSTYHEVSISDTRGSIDFRIEPELAE
jgi:hypothetical protein